MPEFECNLLLGFVEVLGGHWSRGLHCVDDLDPSESRSVVSYGEYHVLEKDKYKHVENINTTNLQH